ncbi:MAG: type II toxin-antitoxin system Phd/YefM family antitoxin [Opitutales bacterium]
MRRQFTVGDFKARFSDILALVQEGETVEVTYGRQRTPVAVVSPPAKKQPERQLGRLKGMVCAEVAPDWSITEEDLAGQ